jgi:HlyD family secretion protein
MPKNGKSSWIKWVFILLILGGSATAGYKFWQKSQTSPPEYKTTTISRGDVTQSVTASGQLNPVMTVQVGSQVSGILKKVLVDFNSLVTNGQVVAQLDPATYEANLLQAEAELANAEAGLELAQLNAERAKKLSAESLISKADADKAIADLHQAEASVKIRRASVEKVRVDVSRTTIYSPIDGVVISREVDVGQTVAASLNAPVLFKIANDLGKMQIDAMVSEADIGGVEVGQEVTFNVDAFPMRTFRGKVFQVRNSPVTTQNVVTYDTVVEVNTRDMKLKPGMTATVSIITARQENVLRIPNAALRFRPPEATPARTNAPAASNAVAQAPRPAAPGGASPGGERGGRGSGGGRGGGGGNFRGGAGGGAGRAERNPIKTVYLAARGADGKIEPKPVQIKTGISDTTTTEILEGLNEGDEIIVSMTTSETEAARPAANPFGGSGSFRRY